jgi:hypothetical protein
MKHDSFSQPIAWFQDQYKGGHLELRPPFQRKPVWTDKQRSFLIESILLDIPIPEIYVQVTQLDEEGTQEYGVVVIFFRWIGFPRRRFIRTKLLLK